MNTRESAGVKEIETQRELALSRAAEYAGLLAEAQEQLAAAVKTIEELSAAHAKLQLQLIERNQQLLEARAVPGPVAIQDDRN